jgi:hypothetical protein
MLADVPDPLAWLLYVVDAPLHGGLATSIARVLALWIPDALNTQPITVVSIGPRIATAADYADYLQRGQIRDLVPRDDPAGDASSAAEAFLDFLQSQVDPAVRQRTRALKQKALIFGHGLSGLFACHALATQHPMFDRYIVASPTLLDDSPTRQAILQAPGSSLDVPNPRHDGATGRGFHDLATVLGRRHRPALRARTDLLAAESFESLASVALINGLRWHFPSTGHAGRRMVLRHLRGYFGLLLGMLRMFRQAKRQQKKARSAA